MSSPTAVTVNSTNITTTVAPEDNSVFKDPQEWQSIVVTVAVVLVFAALYILATRLFNRQSKINSAKKAQVIQMVVESSTNGTTINSSNANSEIKED